MLRLNASGAALKVLDSSIDMTSPSGEWILQVLGAVAEFEEKGWCCLSLHCLLNRKTALSRIFFNYELQAPSDQPM